MATNKADITPRKIDPVAIRKVYVPYCTKTCKFLFSRWLLD